MIDRCRQCALLVGRAGVRVEERQSGLRTGARRDRRIRIRRHRARRLGFHAHRARDTCGSGWTGGASPWSARSSRHVWPIPVRTKRACTPRSRRRDCSPAVGDGRRPVIVLSDEPTADPVRTGAAGRVQPALGLTGRQWDDAARGVERIAAAVRDETGLRTVFHHHCAGYVETPDEIDALMQRTDPSLVGLCLDSGHATYGGGSPLELLSRHRARTWHVHFKDCEPQIAERAPAGAVGLPDGASSRALLRAGARQRRFSRVAPRPAGCGLRRLDRRRAGCAAGDGLAGGERDAQPAIPAGHRTVGSRFHGVPQGSTGFRKVRVPQGSARFRVPRGFRQGSGFVNRAELNRGTDEPRGTRRNRTPWNPAEPGGTPWNPDERTA